jgi:hypothetical protein
VQRAGKLLKDSGRPALESSSPQFHRAICEAKRAP